VPWIEMPRAISFARTSGGTPVAGIAPRTVRRRGAGADVLVNLLQSGRDKRLRGSDLGDRRDLAFWRREA